MPAISADITDTDLLQALRDRGYAISAWTVDDAASVIENDDTLMAEIGDADIDPAAEVLFASCRKRLEAVLGERGNEVLDLYASINKKEMLAAVQQGSGPKR